MRLIAFCWCACRHVPWVLLYGLLLAGCGSGARTVAVHRLRFAPVVGSRNGPPESVLFGVLAGRVLRGGAIVIGDNGSRELRFYARDGSWLRSAGRRGKGPGEFESITAIYSLDDTLYVFDGHLGRMSVFAGSGRYVRTFSILSEGLSWPIGITDDRRLLVASGAPATGVAHAGLVVDSADYGWYDLDGKPQAFVARLPAGMRVAVTGEDGVRTIQEAPFSAAPSAVVAGNGIVFSDGEGAIRFLDESGRVVRTSRPATPPVEITDAAVDAYRRERLSRAGARRARVALVLRNSPFPRYYPVIAGLAGGNGGVWAQRYRTTRDPDTEWYVLGPAGSLSDRYAAPDKVRVLDVQGKQVLAVRTDELGVETVGFLVPADTAAWR
ncbi:MAG: hypothetical protein P8Z36_07445 [Gemmatimonadota bacterium]|jgi:hypothetical protein